MRIVSLLPSATEIVCALGLEENLIGITHECDYPPSVAGKPHLTASRISHETMNSAEIDHAVRSQLDGHGSIYDLNTGLLAALEPDLIITQELCEVCAVSYKTVERAARMYVAGARVVSLEPNTIEDIFANIKTVGELCNVSEKAEEVVDDLRERLRRLREQSAEAATRPKVFMLEWLEPPFAPGHWVPEQTEAAGGISLLGEAGEKSVATTYEKIVESAPERLVLIPCGYYAADILRQLPHTIFPESFREIPAVRAGEVWALDATAYFSRPAPRVIDGAEILAKIVHPEIFGAPSERQAVRVSADLLRFSRTVSN
ncbi:MAG TPA: cobalamin-binding protein [Pyrinomonadaceae bacterium]|jgi:iron complex transport system substrate-binding protein